VQGIGRAGRRVLTPQRRNERLTGGSGTGKSHLLIALGTEAAMAGYRVRYTLAVKLANELVEAPTTGS
jgi:DNA replication protein DnaC